MSTSAPETVVPAVTRVFNWNPHSPQLDLKAASWLLVYLIGMGAPEEEDIAASEPLARDV